MKKAFLIKNEIDKKYERMMSLKRDYGEAKTKEERDRIDGEITYLVISNHVLMNNCIIALFNESISDILEVINRYKGRKCGEKTRDKIRDEIRWLIGGKVYLDKHKMSVHFDLINKDIEFCTKDGFVDNDNKINAIDVNDVILCDADEYIEDVDSYAKSLKALRDRAYKAREEFENACDEYNNRIVDNMGCISIYNFFSKEMRY